MTGCNLAVQPIGMGHATKHGPRQVEPSLDGAISRSLYRLFAGYLMTITGLAAIVWRLA
jgi:hypothetical protein